MDFSDAEDTKGTEESAAFSRKSIDLRVNGHFAQNTSDNPASIYQTRRFPKILPYWQPGQCSALEIFSSKLRAQDMFLASAADSVCQKSQTSWSNSILRASNTVEIISEMKCVSEKHLINLRHVTHLGHLK